MESSEQVMNFASMEEVGIAMHGVRSGFPWKLPPWKPLLLSWNHSTEEVV